MEKPFSEKQQTESLSRERSAVIGYESIKRLFDIVVGVFGFMILAIVIVCVGPFYLFGKNRGPLFFKQERLGLNGEKFVIYKFRSMVVNAEEVLKKDQNLYHRYVQNSFKLPEGEDPRVTKLGRFLRKTSLDELPQFINILKGDMSLIGPRPVIASELKEYGDDADLFLSAKPGAMGLWQASGRSKIHYPERAKLEVYYVTHRCFSYDIKILFKNIASIIKADGAF